ncbi:hypothetical protein FB446DRAFT_167376 [Lentinula raphanica]|nr:hypothetical protein FB446DRAFT_167376 [Lentinula raphanica]
MLWHHPLIQFYSLHLYHQTLVVCSSLFILSISFFVIILPTPELSLYSISTYFTTTLSSSIASRRIRVRSFTQSCSSFASPLLSLILIISQVLFLFPPRPNTSLAILQLLHKHIVLLLNMIIHITR